MSTKIEVQIITAILILWLILSGSGLFQKDFFIFKVPLAVFAAFIWSLFFLLISIKGRKKFWIIVFSVLLIILNPFYSFISFVFTDLKIFYFITAIIFAIFTGEYYNTYKKGTMFENYVADMFPDGIWTIVDRAKNYSKKIGRIVESDKNPDFVFRHNTTGNKIAVECKYRSYFYFGGVEILKNQLQQYKQYSLAEKIPVFIFIGVGNSPKNPQNIFVIPLEKLENLINNESEIISKEKLERFKINSKKEFIKDDLYA